MKAGARTRFIGTMGSNTSKPTVPPSPPRPAIPVLCELWQGFKEGTYDIRINFIGVSQDKIATVHKTLRSVFTSKGQSLSDVTPTLITSAIVPISDFESIQSAINRVPTLKVRWYDFVHLKTKQFESP